MVMAFPKPGYMFEIVGFNEVPEDLLNEVSALLSNAFNSQSKILHGGQLPLSLANLKRLQYVGELVLRYITRFRSIEDSIIVAIVEGDAYVHRLNFIFGLADPLANAAVVFLSRLRTVLPKERDKEVFLARVRKEVMHEVGHVLGLRHCSNRKCVMTFSNSIFDTDFKDWKYCRSCAGKLIRSGIKLNPNYIIA
jgi:archaemetzincin